MAETPASSAAGRAAWAGRRCRRIELLEASIPQEELDRRGEEQRKRELLDLGRQELAEVIAKAGAFLS
jgi:hypothetical protein